MRLNRREYGKTECWSQACAQGCSQWALRATADFGTRTLRGQNTATVHQFWACFREGLHFNWEEVSHSWEVCSHTCLPRWEEMLWESELSWEDTERSPRWCSLTCLISTQGTAVWQQRQRPACGEQVSMQTQSTFILMRSLSEEKNKEYIQSGKGLVFSVFFLKIYV